MRRTTITVALAALLALTGCSGGNDDAEADAPLEFADVEAFNDHVAERFNGTAKLNGGSDLMIGVESKNSELQDKDRTLKVLEDIGEGVKFDYETVSIAAKPDKGEWGFQYTRETVQKIHDASVGDGSVIVTEIWDDTELGYNTAY